MAGKPYILFCAGEDSGDCLGESLVRETFHCGILAKGSGGVRMQGAGMEPLVNFETLPVSGFADVLPKYFELRRSYARLLAALESSDCRGLVAIDYPGFNMKLVKRAGELRKPALYVAPPQVWAWKKRRAQELSQNPMAQLAVFFDFEERAYAAAGCNVVRMRHPFASLDGNGTDPNLQRNKYPRMLLLPGSRKAQALRNLPLFLDVATEFSRIHSPGDPLEICLMAARESLVPALEKGLREKGLSSKVQVLVAPTDVLERKQFYWESLVAVTSPGTATLELALSGTPMVVCYKPDLLTYFLAKRFVKTELFALPNLILNRKWIDEFICNPCCRSDLGEIAESVEQSLSNNAQKTDELMGRMEEGLSAESLMSEFLSQFF